MIVKTQSFAQDSLIRNDKGVVIGRLVLVDILKYQPGDTFLNVAVIKVLKIYCTNILGFELYIDGVKYKVPDTIHKIKIRKNEKEHIVTNFILKKA